MIIYVLEGHIPYEGSNVLGAYASYREAVEAAQAYDRADREAAFTVGYQYLVNEVVVGAPAQDRILDGQEVKIEEGE